MKRGLSILLFCILFVQCKETRPLNAIPLFENGQGAYACYRIPAIIKSSDGSLLAFAEGRTNNCADFGDVDILLRRSSDGGATWSLPKVVASFHNLQAGNPAPVVDRLDPNYPEGRIFLFYNTGDVSEQELRLGKGTREVWYKTSVDHGRSWSEGINITPQVHFNASASQAEKDWRTHATTPGHALQFEKGKYKGRLYIPANHSQGPPQENFNEYRAYGFYSDDHGGSWNVSPDVDIPSSNEAIGVELSNGTLMLNIREQSGRSHLRLIALSTSGGSSWEKTYFDPELISPVCQSSLLPFVSNQDTLLIYSGPDSREKRERMSLKISPDQGKTWSHTLLIDPGAAAYSDMVQIDPNHLGLLYEKASDGIVFQSISSNRLFLK